MNVFVKPLLFVCAFCISGSLLSQGTIRGVVKDQNGEPVLFIVVGLEGTTYANETDQDGYYTLSKVPAGEYTILIRSFDYKEVREKVTVKNNQVIQKNFLLEESEGVTTGVVEINATTEDQQNDVRIGVESISSRDIKRMPSVGGQPDLAQYLQNLPGVVTTGDQGGQLYIRGGSPVQNKVLLDGMIVYNAFHSIGLFSVFDTEVISNADVYTGGFSAQYGGRISSVMDITTRDGNKAEADGRIGISPFGIRGHVEGPLRKLKPNGSGISYIFSGKRSYLDQVSTTPVYDYVNDGEGLPFSFTDLYGKISFGGGNGSKFNLFGFSFNDGVTNYQNLGKLAWKNNGAGGNFVVVPGGASVLISGNFAWSGYEIELNEENLPSRSSSIQGFNGGLEFKYIIKKDILKYGVELVGFNTNYETFAIADGRSVTEGENTSEINVFFDYKFNRTRWVIEPSLRIQRYSSLSVFSPEPRLGIKYKWNEVFRIKAAAGIYTQNLVATNSDRDVVNLFYGFLASPQDLPTKFTTANGDVRETKNALQRANHYLAGFEYDITEKLNLNVEGYYKDFRQLTNTNRNKVYSATDPTKPDELKKDFLVETGWAAGADLALKYEEKRYFFWLVYSLTKVSRWDGFREYAPVFDRRHNVNIIGNYKFGEKRDYEFSVRWNLGSGLPFTQTQGYYQAQGIDGGIAMDYVSNNPNSIGIQFADLNKGRLPYYHRLDVNVKKSVKLANKLTLEVNVGCSNVYNRANVFYIDRITAKRVDQLPVLPTIGLDLSF